MANDGVRRPENRSVFSQEVLYCESPAILFLLQEIFHPVFLLQFYFFLKNNSPDQSRNSDAVVQTTTDKADSQKLFSEIYIHDHPDPIRHHDRCKKFCHCMLLQSEHGRVLFGLKNPLKNLTIKYSGLRNPQSVLFTVVAWIFMSTSLSFGTGFFTSLS